MLWKVRCSPSRVFPQRFERACEHTNPYQRGLCFLFWKHILGCPRVLLLVHDASLDTCTSFLNYATANEKGFFFLNKNLYFNHSQTPQRVVVPKPMVEHVPQQTLQYMMTQVSLSGQERTLSYAYAVPHSCRINKKLIDDLLAAG